MSNNRKIKNIEKFIVIGSIGVISALIAVLSGLPQTPTIVAMTAFLAALLNYYKNRKPKIEEKKK